MSTVQVRPAVGSGPALAAVVAVAAAASALVVLDLVVQVLSGSMASYPVDVTLFLVAMAGLLAAGAVVVVRDRERGLGLLLLGVAATGSLFDLLGSVPGDGPAAFLRNLAYWPYAGLFAHLLLRWPDHRVHGTLPRVLLGCFYALPPVLSLGWQLTWDPRWFDPPAPDLWWPHLAAARGLSASLFDAQELVLLALIVALLVVVVVRVRRADRARRRALVPVALAASLLAAAVLLELIDALGAALPIDVGLIENLAVLIVPIAVLIRRPVADEDTPHDRRERTPLEQVRARYAGLIGFVVAGATITAIAVTISVRNLDVDAAPDRPAPGPAVVQEPAR